MRKRDANGTLYQADGIRLSCGCESGKQNAILGEATMCLVHREVVEVVAIVREGTRTR